MREVKETVTKFFTKCPKCGREIKGLSEGQALSNLRIHDNIRHGKGGPKAK